MEALWAATQEPGQHQRWDVRFGSIEYLPLVAGEPQRFTYATRVAPGVVVAGTGESLGDRDRADGSRWSGLRYWADDKRSLIEAGAGYWRYVPTEDGIRFLTRYDYRTRWGALGETVDRRIFRPLFGWATAWSFDRLRLWLEQGLPPERARDQAIAHAAAVAGLSGVWLYQGLVPKLWRVDPGEVSIWQRFGMSESRARTAVRTAGAAEVLLGAMTIVGARHRWPFAATALAMPVLTAAAATTDRSLFARAFNPASLNWAMTALAAVALATHDGRPSGRLPLRTAPDRQPDVGDLP
ncbi:MAG: hypothetical protein QOF30_583 [Acidimicrobiaceae bacterium]|jgi:hypothetical protein|nr:hypothetical protein [Acidimicrobiaceae bacterium]